MFTEVTYQDWLRASDRAGMMIDVIGKYKSSDDFHRAMEADDYFHAQNRAVGKKVVLKPTTIETQSMDYNGVVTKKSLRQQEIAGNRIYSNFLFRFVVQQNQYLLGNGVTLESEAQKKRLGPGFDRAMQQMGEKALLHGVCWGYWNHDHIEVIPAETDKLSGSVALLDERTGEPGALIQFWQLSTDRPMYVRVFEPDGISEYRTEGENTTEVMAKRPYKRSVATDAAGSFVRGEENYGRLPIVPLYASDTKTSEFTGAIKSKIDLYDRIFSDFGDNLDRANDVYWVLNNFGGSFDEVSEMIAQIERLRAVVNISDGTGSGSTAEPRTFEVPYAARQTALQLLEKALYQDFMAMSMDELTGGSLTNVAIETAMTNLNLKADRFEWQAFGFVQHVLELIGVETEKISFHRQAISNKSEIVQDIAVMRDYIDVETALKLNPYILQEDIPKIMDNLDAERVSGMPTVESLQQAMGGDA